MEQLTMVFEDPSRPLVVAYSPQEISLELRYRIENNQPAYRLSVRAQNNTHNIKVTQDGESFNIPDLGITGKVTLQNKFRLRAYKLPGLFVFILGALFLLAGAIQFLLPAPIFIYIKTVTKGRGSRIEANIEGLASEAYLQKTLSEITQREIKNTNND